MPAARSAAPGGRLAAVGRWGAGPLAERRAVDGAVDYLWISASHQQTPT